MATPIKGDLTCVLSTCLEIIAQVDCIVNVLQGTTACIDIQFFNKNGEALDLDRFSDIQILLFDELECGLANFWYPDIPTGEKGFLIEILQTVDTSGNYTNKGLVRICLTKECTSTSPGNIFAEIRLTENTTDGEEIYGITCIQVAKILESKIYKNLDTKCG